MTKRHLIIACTIGLVGTAPAFGIDYGEGNSLSDLLKNNPEWSTAQGQQTTHERTMGVAGRAGDNVMMSTTSSAKTPVASDPAAFDHVQTAYD